MGTEPGVVVHVDAGIHTVELNREEKRNALDLDDRQALLDALRTAHEDASCRVLVLTGRGPVFSAGGDIRAMSPDDPAGSRRRLAILNEIVTRVVEGPIPVVAAVEGGAFGMGLSLAAAADVVVAADDARFCASFGKLGLVADTGLFHTLPLRTGRSNARRLLLTADTIDAVEAHRIGLVDTLVAPGEARSRAHEAATALAALSKPVLAATKRRLAEEPEGLAATLAFESDTQVRMLTAPDFREGREAFLTRRAPHFTGD